MTIEQLIEDIAATGAEIISTEDGITHNGEVVKYIQFKPTSYDNYKVAVALAEQYVEENSIAKSLPLQIYTLTYGRNISLISIPVV